MTMSAPFALGPARVGGGTIYCVTGCTLGREVYWTLTGPGSLVRMTKYPWLNGVAAACYDAGAGTAGQTPIITASQPSDTLIYPLMNPSFETAGATAYDARHWDFAYGNNGASLWTSSGFVERAASLRGRLPSVTYGAWDSGCIPVSGGSYLWSFVSQNAGNGCSGNTQQFWSGFGGIVGYTACWAQISQIASWDDVASLTIPYYWTGLWNAHYGSAGAPRLQVYITSTINTSHGSWSPGFDSSTDRYANVDISRGGSAQSTLGSSSIVIDTSAISGNKYLVIRVLGGASTTSQQWLALNNIVTT